MACQQCGSARVLRFSGKCDDRFSCQLGERDINDYVPHDIGLGGGDYIRGNLCLDCGHLHGKWPLPPAEIEEDQ